MLIEEPTQGFLPWQILSWQYHAHLILWDCQSKIHPRQFRIKCLPKAWNYIRICRGSLGSSVLSLTFSLRFLLSFICSPGPPTPQKTSEEKPLTQLFKEKEKSLLTILEPWGLRRLSSMLELDLARDFFKAASFLWLKVVRHYEM